MPHGPATPGVHAGAPGVVRQTQTLAFQDLYLSTTAKLGIAMLDALTRLAAGRPWLPSEAHAFVPALAA